MSPLTLFHPSSNSTACTGPRSVKSRVHAWFIFVYVHRIYHMLSVTHVNLSFCESFDTVSFPSPPLQPHPPDLIHPLTLPDILFSLSHLTFLTLVFVAQTASHLPTAAPGVATEANHYPPARRRYPKAWKPENLSSTGFS